MYCLEKQLAMPIEGKMLSSFHPFWYMSLLGDSEQIFDVVITEL